MEWVSAVEAVKLLGGSPQWYSDSPEARAILRYARDGLVRARARAFVRETSRESVRETDVDVPESFWTALGEVTNPESWHTGSFAAQREDTREMLRVLGVQFRRTDLQDLNAILGGGSTSVTPAAPAVPRKAGRKLDLLRWQSFYFAVIQMAKNGELNSSKFASASALWDEIALEMGDDAWDRDHAKPYVSMIYKKFVGG
ncbi:MAG: hypothetical protein ACLGHC_08215 [Alphaproteobacteria bacterium]